MVETICLYHWQNSSPFFMPLILNIESATDICSVCISEGERVLAFSETTEPFMHSKKMTLLIEECLNNAKKNIKDLSAIAVSSGPGSYTSLRVGFSVAKGICYALDKPFIALDTLQTLALAAFQQEKNEDALYVPMIDARRMEVYSADFSANGKRDSETRAEIITENSYSKTLQSEKKVIYCGNGAAKCQSVITSPHALFLPIVCSALHLPSLSMHAFEKNKFEDIAYFAPHYFKAPNITKSKKRLL